MKNVTIELDAVKGEELVGESDTGFGFVTVTLLTVSGPAAHPVIHVAGPAPSVLAWMVNEYCDYETALELLQRLSD